MGYAGCDLTCEIESLHGEFEDLSGTVCVQAKAGGGIIFSAKLAGLETDEEGGFHIHSGDACSPGSSQGGHYWKNEPFPTGFTGPWCPIDDDPWVPDAPYFSFWASDSYGNAEPVVDLGAGITEGGLFNVGDVNANCGVKGHAVIVHASSGTRIGCCVLE